MRCDNGLEFRSRKSVAADNVWNAGDTETMDTQLERFHSTAPSYDGGMSNHGPMVVEALETAGLSEYAAAFTDQALVVLEPLPEAEEVELVFGDRQEAAWIAHYRSRIRTTSVDAVVRQSLPELLPGLMAGATHGVIRLSHAVRGWNRSPSDVRAEEVAHALGYWAAWYQALPGQVGSEPAVDLRTAMATLPGLSAEEQSNAGFIMDRVRAVDDVPRFIQAIAKVDLRSVSTSNFLSEMVGIAARIMLTSTGSGFAQLHAITATASVRPLLPYVVPENELDVRKAVFHAVASLHAAHGGSREWVDWRAPDGLPDVETLVAAAARSGGDHAIKLAVAVLQEYSVREDPALLAAARAEIGRVTG
jgi:hypothetical protein